MYSIVRTIDAPSDGFVYDLTTVEAVNTALGIEGDSAADAATAAEITLYSRLIGELCNRIFAQATVEETFRIHECYTIAALPLRHYPVTEVASVTANGATWLADVNYELNPHNGLLHPYSDYWKASIGPGRVTVIYTGGYVLPDEAPASLSQAVIAMIEDARTIAAANVSGGGGTLIRDIQHGDRRVSYYNAAANVSTSNAAIPAAVADLIKPFKRVVLA